MNDPWKRYSDQRRARWRGRAVFTGGTMIAVLGGMVVGLWLDVLLKSRYRILEVLQAIGGLLI